MKKLLSAILALALAFTLCACAENAVPDTPEQDPEPAVQTDPEDVTPEENTDPVPDGLDDMPEPYERREGTDYYLYSFHSLFTMPFDDAFLFDGICTDDEFHEWCESLRGNIPTSLTESANCYSAILRFGLTDEQAREFYVSNMILPDEDMDVILSRDEAAIFARFARAETIVIGGRGYAPEWLYYHSVSDWEAAGISAENVEAKLSLYAEIPLSDDAKDAFAKKLSDFLGYGVSLGSADPAPQYWNDAPAPDPDVAPDPDSVNNDMPWPFDVTQVIIGAEKFSSDGEYAIAVGESVFPPDWLYYSEIGEWAEVGITPEAVEEKLPLYAEIGFSDEARKAFMDKIAEFIGH